MSGTRLFHLAPDLCCRRRAVVRLGRRRSAELYAKSTSFPQYNDDRETYANDMVSSLSFHDPASPGLLLGVCQLMTWLTIPEECWHGCHAIAQLPGCQSSGLQSCSARQQPAQHQAAALPGTSHCSLHLHKCAAPARHCPCNAQQRCQQKEPRRVPARARA